MSVLCNRPTLLGNVNLNIKNQSLEMLKTWYMLFLTAQTDVKKPNEIYKKIMKQLGCIILEIIIKKDLVKTSREYLHTIVPIFDEFIKDNSKETFMALINITKYLHQYISQKQLDGMIKMILSLVSKVDMVYPFQELLELAYPNFTFNKLLDIFPNNPDATDLLLSITCKFTGEDNIIIDINDKRAKIYNNLTKLLELENLPIVSLERVLYINTSNFFLSYHGLSSKNMFELKTKLIRKICPELSYKIDTNYKNSKIKVAFVSSFLTRIHSVFKDRHQVIIKLSENPLFDVCFITIDDLTSDVKNIMKNVKHYKMERNLRGGKLLLEDMKLDVIVYCEIGMDPFFYLMAFMKLAKIQINTWGHSDTSGIDTIDYFFSSKYYELEYDEAQTHYTEKLVLLNSLCTCYINPMSKYINMEFKDRYNFGFSKDSVVYFCGQSLFKFTHAYYDYVIQILDRNPNAVIIMITGDSRKQFIDTVNHSIINRIHWSCGVGHKDYMNLISISDIVLDTYPFGGCNSSLEGFSLGKVVVTQPSEMINGRFTKGFYEKMGLLEYVTNSKEEYIDFAIKLADKKFREPIEKAILSKKDMLFNDIDSVTDWSDKLVGLTSDL
jgi:hypothetical protein